MAERSAASAEPDETRPVRIAGMSALAQAFSAQAAACESLGSPFMGRLMRLAPEAIPSGPVRDRLEGWEGDVSNRGDSVPLRLAGALHALVRKGDPLAAVYPPRTVPDAALVEAVREAVTRRADTILAWLESPPQTNEVRRSAALILAAHLVAARHGLPLALSELGASAGLNLGFPNFALDTPAGRIGPPAPALVLRPDWRGAAPSAAFAAAGVTAPERAGVDLSPIDPRDPGQRARLMAYLWPDQPERADLTAAAIAAGPPPIEQGDAVDWLAARLAVPRPGHLHLVYHTVAWQYLPEAARARGESLLSEAGTRTTPEAPLACLSVEGDGGRGAHMRLTTWPGGQTEVLGRMCFHGRWLDWAGIGAS